MEVAAGRYALVTKGLMKNEVVKVLPDKTDDESWVIVRFNEGGKIALPKEDLKVLG